MEIVCQRSVVTSINLCVITGCEVDNKQWAFLTIFEFLFLYPKYDWDLFSKCNDSVLWAGCSPIKIFMKICSLLFE